MGFCFSEADKTKHSKLLQILKCSLKTSTFLFYFPAFEGDLVFLATFESKFKPSILPSHQVISCSVRSLSSSAFSSLMLAFLYLPTAAFYLWSRATATETSWYGTHGNTTSGGTSLCDYSTDERQTIKRSTEQLKVGFCETTGCSESPLCVGNAGMLRSNIQKNDKA